MSGGRPELDHPDLIQAVRLGDRTAVARVLELCLPSVRRIILAHFHLSAQECDDVLQEVQVGFLAAAPRFRGDCSLHTYLVQIARRKCVDYLRARHRDAPYWQQPGLEQTMMSNIPDLETVDERLAIEDALACLTRRERQLLDLFYVQARSYKEIAAKMGIAIGSVGAMKAEALVKLRQAVDGKARPAQEIRDEQK